MNCQKAKNIMAISVYGRPTPVQYDELMEHIKTCQACARRYERSSQLMNLQPENDEIPLPDPERSWKIISARALGWRRHARLFPMRKWALAAFALLAVFGLGYFIGKHIMNRGGTGFYPAAAGDSSASFAAYADNLKPVLINFLNHDQAQSPESIQRLEQQIISDMLDQTRLLKSLAASSNDTALIDLLQDLEFILTAMDNLRPEDRDSARHLARLIREKQVPIRLHELITLKATI